MKLDILEKMIIFANERYLVDMKMDKKVVVSAGEHLREHEYLGFYVVDPHSGLEEVDLRVVDQAPGLDECDLHADVMCMLIVNSCQQCSGAADVPLLFACVSFYNDVM